MEAKEQREEKIEEKKLPEIVLSESPKVGRRPKDNAKSKVNKQTNRDDTLNLLKNKNPEDLDKKTALVYKN